MPAFAFIPGGTIQWVAVLIDAAAKGMVVLLLAAGTTLLLRRSSAAVRHMTWTLSIAALILVPFLSLALPQLHVPLLPDWAGAGGPAWIRQPAPSPLALPAQWPSAGEPRVGTGGLRAESIMPAGDWPSPAGTPQPVPPADAAMETAAPQPPPVHWSVWVLLAWLAGAAALLLPLLAGTTIVWRQARRAKRINSGSWGHLLDELRPQLGVRGRVVLLRSNWPNIPLTCGIFRPAIILPAEADNWPDDRRRVVLLHEFAHIRRADCLTQLLARLARVIYWFNPLVWLAGRMLRIEREQACDDLVLASGHKASDYAQHLLDIVGSLRSVRCPSLAAVAMARKSQFEGRLLAILDPRRNRRAMTRLGILLAAVLAAAFIVPLAVLKATGPEEPLATKPAKPATHPAIGIYIVTDHPKGISFEKTPLADFTLAAEPLVSEADIFTYDWGTHTIRLNRQAVADRVLNRKGSGGHFVVVVDGQRLYRGAMVSVLTSIVPAVPIINVGPTAEQWQPKFAIRIYPPPGDAPDPRSDDRLKRALLALNKLSNTVDRSPATQPAAPDEKTKPFTYKLGGQPDAASRAIINRIFSSGVATRPAPEATSTQPAGSKLEFRTAPSASSLTKAERDSYMDWLKAGRVGFWWKGGRIRGRMPDHAWLAFAGDMANAGNLVTGEYKGQKYVLVSDKPGQTMLPGEGKEAWGLAKVFATTDAMNLPAVGFELDDRGAELFSALSKANIGNALAIVVDGKVVSAPVIRAALGKQGMILGRFSEQEVQALVKALKAGMPPAKSSAPAIGHTDDGPSTQPAPSTSSGQAANKGARIKLGSSWQAALDIHEGEVRLRLKDAAGKTSTLRYSQVVLDSAAGIRATTGPSPSASAGQADGATKDRVEVTSAAIAVIDAHAGNIRVRCGGRTLEAAEIVLEPAKAEATTQPAPDGASTQPAKGADNKTLVARVYDVRDLIREPPTAIMPDYWADFDLKYLFRGDSQNAAKSKAIEQQNLGKLIDKIKEIDRDSWLPEAKIGGIRILYGAIVITQTAKNHARITDVIDMLRNARPLRVEIALKFIHRPSDLAAGKSDDLPAWLSKNVKGRFEEKTGLLRLSDDEIEALLKHVRSGSEYRLHYAPPVTCPNGRAGNPEGSGSGDIMLPRLDKNNEKVNVTIPIGLMAAIKPTVDANRQSVACDVTTWFAEVISQGDTPAVAVAEAKAAFTVPDKGTMLLRVEMVKHKLEGARQAARPAGLAKFDVQHSPVEKGKQEKGFVYILIRPQIIEPTEPAAATRPADAPMHMPSATQPAV